MPARVVGIFAGLVIAATVVALVRPLPTAANGPLVSECNGAVRAIVIQYCAGGEFTLPVYRQFLRQLGRDVRIYAVCPEQRDFDELRDVLWPIDAKLIAVITGHAITCWSRDRFVTLNPRDRFDRRILLCPREENASEVWPERGGDQQVAFDVAHADPNHLQPIRSPLIFDGGDILADSTCAFVTPAVAQRNVQHTVRDLEDLKRTLALALGRRIVLLDDAPQHHAGMYMASIGNNRMLVGDPRLGRAFVSQISRQLLDSLPGGADFTDQTAARFDHVAEQVRKLGYRVIRIPTICAADAKTYLTYVNGIIDVATGSRRVYMPAYRDADALNAAAERIWRDAGYEVTPIDCTSVFTRFGTLHCLVNVIERS